MDARVESLSSQPDEFAEVLASVERRVLWLATTIVQHANTSRGKSSGVKIGGHQASSASIASIMTALFFAHVDSRDLVSVKPHASPVLHAINYLLGWLDESYLTELRAFRGLQSYPSRTKDPDPIDFSTGSVGIGATATLWSALSQRYIADHFDGPGSGRHVALLGDAELDEGAVWEALIDPMVGHLDEVMWIVDLNRQSLDRIVPDIAIDRIDGMFEAAGWQTVSVKYGRLLRAVFDRPDGDALRDRLDSMTNGEYQRMLRAPRDEVRARLSSDARTAAPLGRLLADIDDHGLGVLVRDLGGHDLVDLCSAMQLADATSDRPTVIFAYTLKARGLPTEGHPGNHSALLSDEQWRDLAVTLDVDVESPWERFEPGSAEADLCRTTADRLRRDKPTAARPPSIPKDLSRSHPPVISTQQALGRFLVDLERHAPDTAASVVTVSPDVASSTNLGSWINKVGVWNVAERTDWFENETDVLMHWHESCRGRHIELGIAEGNLVGLLGELGTTWSRYGKPTYPIGTIYDPFITRALEPWSFAMYAGGQSILVGTPSGVSLAPEGGAHQSVISPSIGIAQPQCVAWEPAFAQDLEWTMLYALSRLGRTDGSSSYFRLSTRPIDQSISHLPTDLAGLEQRRRGAVAGGYVLQRADETPQITLVGMGVLIAEVVDAASSLENDGICVEVICVTSADLLFRASRAQRGLGDALPGILASLFPRKRAAPIVTVLDGHPHALAFLSSINGVPATHLGVDDFGEAGGIEDLYARFGIDTATIVGAAHDLLDIAR